jgi:hypothetical protein
MGEAMTRADSEKAFWALKARDDALEAELNGRVMAPAEREAKEKELREGRDRERLLWREIGALAREEAKAEVEERDRPALVRVEGRLLKAREAAEARLPDPATRREAQERIRAVDELLDALEHGPGAGVHALTTWPLPPKELADLLTAEGVRLDVRLGLVGRERRLKEARARIREHRDRIESLLREVQRA